MRTQNCQILFCGPQSNHFFSYETLYKSLFLHPKLSTESRNRQEKFISTYTVLPSIAQWSLYVPPSGHYMYHPVVTIRTASLTFNNSPFCPHSVFMCFVWISEQTAIISLYNFNWLVCVTETECVYCAVRTGCCNIIQLNLCFLQVNKTTTK
jgi:hypothetical protein